MRLDLLVLSKGLTDSRTKAKALVCEGKITVNGKVMTKPSADIPEDAVISSLESDCFVGRGALKLEAAFDRLEFKSEGCHAIDIGASTGGFTQSLLRHGAASVYAVDVGSGQLHESLRKDPRVTVFENYNARYMKPSDFSHLFDVAVCDVSFISQTLIIPQLVQVLKKGGEFVTLIKPQFECGREGLGKSGVVKSDAVRDRAIDRVCECAREHGFELLGMIDSPILGGDGNREFVCRFVLKNTN